MAWQVFFFYGRSAIELSLVHRRRHTCHSITSLPLLILSNQTHSIDSIFTFQVHTIHCSLKNCCTTHQSKAIINRAFKATIQFNYIALQAMARAFRFTIANKNRVINTFLSMSARVPIRVDRVIASVGYAIK